MLDQMGGILGPAINSATGALGQVGGMAQGVINPIQNAAASLGQLGSSAGQIPKPVIGGYGQAPSIPKVPAKNQTAPVISVAPPPPAQGSPQNASDNSIVSPAERNLTK